MIEDITRNTLMDNVEHVPAFMEWLDDRMKLLKDQHLNFQVLVSTLGQNMSSSLLLVNKHQPSNYFFRQMPEGLSFFN